MGQHLRLDVKARIVVAVLLAIGAAAALVTSASTAHPSLSTISNRGRATPLGPRMVRHLRRLHIVPRARVLATRGRKQFVSLGAPPKDHCYGVRRSNAPQFGFTCWDDFPSPAHPILDLSTFGAEPGRSLHLIDLQGFAADGVDAVALLDVSGATLARVPVVGNVYDRSSPPTDAVRIVALDRSGRTLFAVPR